MGCSLRAPGGETTMASVPFDNAYALPAVSARIGSRRLARSRTTCAPKDSARYSMLRPNGKASAPGVIITCLGFHSLPGWRDSRPSIAGCADASRTRFASKGSETSANVACDMPSWSRGEVPRDASPAPRRKLALLSSFKRQAYAPLESRSICLNVRPAPAAPCRAVSGGCAQAGERSQN